jgi:RimJ/RimL family protein N-acetyltransferase
MPPRRGDWQNARMRFTPRYPLEGERLRLRPYAAADFDALLGIQSRPDVARYLYWDARGPAEVRADLEEKIGRASITGEGQTLAMAAELRRDGTLIGGCSLHWTSRAHRQGEIGFVLHPDHHGRGYATEAGRLLLDVGFRDIGLHRIVGRLEARNRASARVLERLGMRREAHLVENEFVKGEWQSEIVYAILDREWL